MELAVKTLECLQILGDTTHFSDDIFTKTISYFIQVGLNEKTASCFEGDKFAKSHIIAHCYFLKCSVEASDLQILQKKLHIIVSKYRKSTIVLLRILITETLLKTLQNYHSQNVGGSSQKFSHRCIL